MDCRLIVPVLLASLAVSLPAVAEDPEKRPEGWEFIDMPEEQPAEAAAAQPEPEDEKETPGYLPGYRRTPSVSLSPHAPQRYSALPGALTPSFGSRVPDRAWRFDFHGYLQGGVRGSIGQREGTCEEGGACENQSKLTLHGDPVVAGGSYGWFDHTRTVPTPWTQLNFHYGNQDVESTVIVGAWSVSKSDDASQSAMPQAQLWINDAYLTFHPPLYDPISWELRVGAFRDRYGAMAKYHEGAYGASLIGAITGVGTTAMVEVPFEWDLTLHLETGFKGELDKPPQGIIQDGWNEHARPQEGSTLAAHGHTGLTYAGIATTTLHYIYAWSQDDRADPLDDPTTPRNEARNLPDGSLSIAGADLRVDGARFGYFYGGAARTKGDYSVRVSDMVKILNTGGGKDLMERFWGFDSNGTGELFIVGGEYNLSLGTLLRYPTEFWGEGPDLFVGLFGIYGHATSPVAQFDDKDMFKYGTELTWSMLPWLATSGRLDHVMPDFDDRSRSFAVFSPKVVFRTEWNAREALTLMYATYFLGSNVRVEGDERLTNNPSGKPDRHMFAAYGSMWW
jgi:hypothetical protein